MTNDVVGNQDTKYGQSLLGFRQKMFVKDSFELFIYHSVH